MKIPSIGLKKVRISFCRRIHSVGRVISNDDGDGNENGKKAMPVPVSGTLVIGLRSCVLLA